MPSKADTFSIRLPDAIKKQVDQIASDTRRSRSFIINEAVAKYVRDRAEIARELDEALQGAEAGEGHSGEQVFAFMDAWSAGEKPPLPAPDVKKKI